MRQAMKFLVFMLYLCAVASYAYHYTSSSEILLWVGVLSSFIAILVSTADSSAKESYRLASAILFLSFLRIPTLLGVPLAGFTFSSDSGDGLQLSYQVQEAAKLGFGMGTGKAVAYSFFPALYVWTAIVSCVSGLSIEVVAWLSPLLTGSLTIVLLYSMIKRSNTSKIALFTVVIYSLCPTFVFFDGNYVSETFGLVFYAMYVMMVFFIYVDKRRSAEFALIAIIASAMVAVSHHWSAWNMIFTAIFLFCSSLIYVRFIDRLQKREMSLRFAFSLLLATTSIILSWFFFVAYEVISKDIEYFTLFFSSFFSPATERALPRMPLNTPLERAFISAGYAVLAIAGVGKFIAISIDKNATKRPFLQSWFIYGSAYIFSSYFGAPARFYYADIRRTWSFAFFGLSPMIALGLVGALSARLGRWRKLAKLRPFLLILPLISTTLSAPLNVRNPNFRTEIESYRNTGIWIGYHLDSETVVVDSFTKEIVAAYGRIERADPPEMSHDVSDDEIVLYKSDGISFVAPSGSVVVLNNEISEIGWWYVFSAKPLEMANATVYTSDLDQRYQRIHDCGSLTTFLGVQSVQNVSRDRD